MINLGGKTVYHLGDTALFSDLRLVGERDELDVALMCIGGHYTMDRHDAVTACELIGARTVIPCHYGTFPPIETDAQAFKADVEQRTSGRGGARRRSRCSSRAGRSASEALRRALGPALEPDRTVLPVVGHERRAQQRRASTPVAPW